MSIENLIKEFLRKDNTFAVVGVSRNPEKYGYKVYAELKKAGYLVYPINPSTSKILGDKCYPSLSALPCIPDVVDVVVPPKITERIVRECKRLGIKKVWMQPGAESSKAIEFCRENNINVLHGICVLNNLNDL